MASYSYISSNKKANAEVENHMGIIKDTVLKEIPDTLSIIITGGYAYGDGGSVISGDFSVPVNDYDLYVVSRKALPERDVKRIETLCCERIKQHLRALLKKKSSFSGFSRKDLSELIEGMKVDIRCVTKEALLKFPPMLRFYDMKRSGRTIYGEELLHLIKDYGAIALSPAEGLRLIFNESTYMVSNLTPSFFKGSPSEVGSLKLMYSVSKTALGMCTALLMTSGGLDRRSLERVSHLKRDYKKMHPKLAKKLPDLPDTLKRYVEFKLSPGRVKPKDSLKAFFDLNPVLEEVLRYIWESQFMIDSSDDWRKMSERARKLLKKRYYNTYIDYYFRNCFKNGTPKAARRLSARMVEAVLNWKFSKSIGTMGYKTSLRRKMLGRDPGIKIISTMPLILFSIKKEGSDERLLEAFDKVASTIVPVKGGNRTDSIKSWDERKGVFLRLHELYFEQKLL
jgi:hypothetical protein